MPRNLKTRLYSYVWTERILKTELSFQTDGVTIIIVCDFPDRVFRKQRFKTTGAGRVLKFLPCSVDEILKVRASIIVAKMVVVCSVGFYR